MAAPQLARDGEQRRPAGRLLVAGVAPFARSLSGRASSADLWTSLDSAVVPGTGAKRLKRVHGVMLDSKAHRRFIAYVNQAKDYYGATAGTSPVSKPLPAYYFVLNLTKAFLTAVEPETTASDKIRHGTSDEFKRTQRYHIQQERIAVQPNGVFRLLAGQTGANYCYPPKHILRLLDLLSYLPEAVDLYADAMDRAPKLLPINSCKLLFADKKGWLRVEIDKDTLRQRQIGHEKVLERCSIFGRAFRLVQSDQRTASYESIETVPYGNSPKEAASGLCTLYDQALIASNRTLRGPQRYLVVSARPNLLSHEAVAFAVFHHLSNMVRYRPQDVEKLKDTKYFWLFSSWVERACENYLLNLASRITGEEHFIE